MWSRKGRECGSVESLDHTVPLVHVVITNCLTVAFEPAILLSHLTQLVLSGIAIVIGAIMCIDIWALLLKQLLGITSLNYCLIGRWFLYMPSSTFVHANIGAAQANAAPFWSFP